MSGEKKHHVYDDIVEHDNKLPLWWQLTLYGTVLFGLVYWYGRRMEAIPSPAQAYAAEVAADRAAAAERARARGTVDDSMLSTLAKDPASVARGRDGYALMSPRLAQLRQQRLCRLQVGALEFQREGGGHGGRRFSR